MALKKSVEYGRLIGETLGLIYNYRDIAWLYNDNEGNTIYRRKQRLKESLNLTKDENIEVF